MPSTIDRQLTMNILRVYRSASPEAIEAGLDWYESAGGSCDRLAWLNGFTLTQSVVALAHLSPRITYAKNLEYLEAVLSGMEKPQACLSATWARAIAAIAADDPMETFGPAARKTRAFAGALLGDRNSVVVDVWAARVAGIEEHLVARPSGYVMVAEAYRRAGRREGLAPRDMQACTWVAQRGAHA